MLSIKEYGSDFAYCDEPVWQLDAAVASVFNDVDFQFFVSGRSALWALLHQGSVEHNWQRVYLPSYYCHEVADFLQTLPIEVLQYTYNPWANNAVDVNAIIDAPTSVVIDVDFFGLQKADFGAISCATFIEDLTHNILAFNNSQADYCFASLRKELPVPVGGYCYSAKNLPLPEATFYQEAEHISLKKLAAMFLKKAYLNGDFSDKTSFRTMLSDAEASFSEQQLAVAMPLTAKVLLQRLDVKAMLQAKSNNGLQALTLLQGELPIVVNFAKNTSGFGLMLSLDCKKQTADLKNHLIVANIYPAVLWPEQSNSLDCDASQMMLMLHVDFRYSYADIQHICRVLKAFFNGE